MASERVYSSCKKSRTKDSEGAITVFNHVEALHVGLYFIQELLHDLFWERVPGDTEQRPLQPVQRGECRLFRTESFDTSPCLYWPSRLKLLLRGDTHLLKEMFGFRPYIDQI